MVNANGSQKSKRKNEKSQTKYLPDMGSNKLSIVKNKFVGCVCHVLFMDSQRQWNIYTLYNVFVNTQTHANRQLYLFFILRHFIIKYHLHISISKYIHIYSYYITCKTCLTIITPPIRSLVRRTSHKQNHKLLHLSAKVHWSSKTVGRKRYITSDAEIHMYILVDYDVFHHWSSTHLKLYYILRG